MHLNDAVGRRDSCLIYPSRTGLRDGRRMVRSHLQLCLVINVTTGPGGINALNGVFGAWTDSIPMLILSGQVKRETSMATYGLTNLRQLGDQEVDIIRMVSGITKYSIWVNIRTPSPTISSAHGILLRRDVPVHAGRTFP